MSPQRPPIMMPPNGVKPIDVLTHLPPLTAVIEAPLPKWQVMMRVSAMSLPINSAVRWETYWWLVP